MLKKSSINRQVSVLIFSVLGLAVNPAWAEKDMDYINALKGEAKVTSMKDEKVTADTESESVVTPSQPIDMDQLTQRVTRDLQKVLGRNDQTAKVKADDLERMVSSSLEEGHKMDDIRSAVNGALASLKAKPKLNLEEKKLESISNALSQIVGKKADKVIDNTSISQARTITVMSGESLYKVSMRLYGVGDYYMALYEANRDSLSSPDKIQVGQVLRVPEYLE